MQQRINDNVLGHELLNGPLVDEMDDAEYIVKLQRVTGVLDEFITERTAFVEQSSYVMDLYNFKVLLQSGVRRMKLSLNQIRIRKLDSL